MYGFANHFLVLDVVSHCGSCPTYMFVIVWTQVRRGQPPVKPPKMAKCRPGFRKFIAQGLCSHAQEQAQTMEKWWQI